MGNFSDIGKQIGETIDQVMNSKEVSELKTNLKTTVNSTIDEVRESITGAAESANESLKGNRRDKNNPYAPNYQREGYREQHRPAEAQSKLPVIRKPRGKVKGILLQVFGTIGGAGFGLGALVTALIFIFGGTLSAGVGAGICLPLTCLGIGAALRGNYLKNRAKRFQLYVEALEEKGYCSIEQLAQTVEKKSKYTVNDLEKMTETGWFFEGHTDEQKTCFIATDDAYQQYLETQRSVLETQKKEEEEETFYQNNPGAKELHRVEEEGSRYLSQIREMNDLIPGIEISEKLDRLELVCSKIFDYVKEHPAKLSEIGRFMSYYLPTTLKLVSAYHEFDIQPVQGVNISKAKKEIEVNMDYINKAFENLLDQLFQEKLLDISTDISVLSTMLTQEGLMGSDFKQEEI